MEAFVDLLVEMGYEKGYAEQAVKETNSGGIEAALDWIAEHPNEPGPSQSTEESSTPAVRSYVCEECGKKLRNDDEMEFHSAKTGHCSFSESSEEVKALTEEERKAKMEALRVRISFITKPIILQVALDEKKKQRLEKEKQNEIEDEKRRRDQGKKLLNAKQEFKEKMERLEAEEKMRQKAEDKAHRAQLLAEIERDRAERRARQNDYASAATTVAPAAPAKPNSASATIPSDECRLQIRTPCGAPLKSTFKPTDKLADVLQYVCNNWPDKPNGLTRSVVDSEGVTLQTTFPTRKFTEEDQSSTLHELGLCPSAVIMANRSGRGYDLDRFQYDIKRMGKKDSWMRSELVDGAILLSEIIYQTLAATILDFIFLNKANCGEPAVFNLTDKKHLRFEKIGGWFMTEAGLTQYPTTQEFM
ncbi:hypothetical protein ACTXT7_009927 [Hymenolepis weldensis]